MQRLTTLLVFACAKKRLFLVHKRRFLVNQSMRPEVEIELDENHAQSLDIIFHSSFLKKIS